jgi:WD40 repeat protein
VSNFVTGQSMSDTTIPWFVDQLCFSPDSKSVAIATEEGGVIIQNLANGTQKRIGIFGGFESNPVGLLHGHLTNDLEANSVAFSPDGKRIAAACEDGKARVWNIN